MIRAPHVALAVAIAAAPLAACGATAVPESPASPPRVAAANEPPVTAPSPPSTPETRARDLVEQSKDFTQVTLDPLQKNADCAAMIPRGPSPSTHRKGEIFHTYVAPDAAQAYRTHATLPDGAAVSKRTFEPKSSAVTGHFVMWKQKGANPDGGDWLYATARADGSILRAGVLGDCVQCHVKERDHDFLFHAM